MRIFIFGLFSLVSIFASNVNDVDAYKSEYTAIKKELPSLHGEAEFLEKRYQEYATEFESQLEVTEKKFTQIREEMIRLRKSPAIGYEGQQNKSRYFADKNTMISVRMKLSHLQKEGKRKLESYEAVFKEKQQRVQYLEKRQEELKTHLYESVVLARKEMIASKKALLSVIKSRKNDIEPYQEAYQKALQRYKTIKEKVDSYL